jgi:hypothetical protein
LVVFFVLPSPCKNVVDASVQRNHNDSCFRTGSPGLYQQVGRIRGDDFCSYAGQSDVNDRSVVRNQRGAFTTRRCVRENGDFNKKSKFLNVHQRKNLR